MKFTVCLFNTLFLFFGVVSLSAQPKHEIRAVWLTTNYGLDWPSKPVSSSVDIAFQKKELCKILDRIQEAKMNMVFFQTRLRGNVIYPSAIEPWSRFITRAYTHNSGYDPLLFAVEECHKRGLECHAWFVVYPMGKTNITHNGVNGSNRHLTRQVDGEYYLDPGNPATNSYLLPLIDEIVKKYDIDGIHFDYIRYPDRADAFPDRKTYSIYGESKDLKDWRRENINKFVYQAYDNVKSLKPWVKVSSSVIGIYEKIEVNKPYRTAFYEVYQDPIDWIVKGKHDFIVPMMYYSDDLFNSSIDNWKKNSNGRWIVPGLGIYLLDEKSKNWQADIILEQVDSCRKNELAGIAYFRAQQLIENKKGILSEIEKRFYRYPATLPPLTWLETTSPLSPETPVAKWEKNMIHLSWEKAKDEKKEVYYHIYYSLTDSVDTSDPKNLLATRVMNTELFLKVKDGEAYYYVVTASDRYHNESKPSPAIYFKAGNYAVK